MSVNSDSPRNVVKYTGPEFAYAPVFLRSTDPLSPINTSASTKANRFYYPLGSLWLNRTTNQIFILADIENNLADWVPITGGAIPPLLQISVPLPVNPTVVLPNVVTGNVNFTSSANTIAITGTPGTNTINFDLTGGTTAVDEFIMQSGTSPVVPDGTGKVTFNGGTVAAGTNPVRTNGTAATTMTLQVQISQATAATDATRIGLAAFSSAQFTVDANGFVTITNFSPFNYVQKATADSPYTLTGTDYYVACDPTAGAMTVRLPDSPTNYRMFTIKDRTGQASTNNISITTVTGVKTIDGATTYKLASNYASVNLIYNGTNYEVY